MNASPRAAILRVSIMLLVVCAIAFGWETSRNSDLQPLVGEVVKVNHVFGGTGGDNKEFTIRYRVRGKNYQLVTRRGIFDWLDGFSDLRRGDKVPVAVSPKAPYRAVLNTVNARYPITLCFAALALVFAAVIAVLALRGRLPRSRR